MKLICILIILLTSITQGKEEFVLDSVPSLYYGKVTQENSFFVSNMYKLIDGNYRLETDTVYTSDKCKIREFEYYLYSSLEDPCFVLIKFSTDTNYIKYYLRPFNKSEIRRDNQLALLGFGNFLFNLTLKEMDTLIFTINNPDIKIKNLEAYTVSKSVKIINGNKEIDQFLKSLNKNFDEPQPMDQYPNYWLSFEYGNPWNSQFRLQGLYTNINDFGTNDKVLLSASLPTFTVCKNDSGEYMHSLSIVIASFFGGVHYVINGIRHLVYTKDELIEKEPFDFSLNFAKFCLGIYSLLNFGFDFPISTGYHYTALTMKLNSDVFTYTMKDSTAVMYMEPKIGFRYIYNSKIGMDLQAGYRFWNHPSPVSEKHPYFSMSLLYPLKTRKY